MFRLGRLGFGLGTIATGSRGTTSVVQVRSVVTVIVTCDCCGLYGPP